MLLLNKKHTDTLIEQTKTKSPDRLQFKMIWQMGIFSFSPPLNLVEQGKWLLVVISFEATNSVFNITDENNSFSVTMEGRWFSRAGAETFNKLQKLLQLRSKNDNKLNV